jgi:hypothetical protein
VNWVLAASVTPNNLFAVHFADANNAYACGTGVIVRSTDAGLSWNVQQISFTGDLYSISFSDSQTGTAAGQLGTILRTISGGIGIQQISTEIPEDFELHQNYPNPFNPVTTIRFQLVSAGYTMLVIYDITGKEVSVLADQLLQAGMYEAQWDATDYPSGIYFYTLYHKDMTGNAGKGFSITRKMILLK